MLTEQFFSSIARLLLDPQKLLPRLRDFIPIVGCGILLQQGKTIRDHSYVGQSIITEKDS
jgi:hypothetical protein